jgi:hypothetical protein
MDYAPQLRQEREDSDAINASPGNWEVGHEGCSTNERTSAKKAPGPSRSLRRMGIVRQSVVKFSAPQNDEMPMIGGDKKGAGGRQALDSTPSGSMHAAFYTMANCKTIPRVWMV